MQVTAAVRLTPALNFILTSDLTVHYSKGYAVPCVHAYVWSMSWNGQPG